MASKKERHLKVYSQSGYYYGNDQRPAIFLQGKWLRDMCGFNIGDHCTVKCSNGRIVITKTTETKDN